MSHFGEASKRVIDWIESDPNRKEDFKKIYPGTVQEYLNDFAYRHDIIPSLVRAILMWENERIVQQINGL